MHTTNLLASVALFRKLYEKDGYNNIYDIIAELIKGAIIYQGKLAYTSEEISKLLTDVYGFDIPDAVIKTTLRHRFADLVKREHNVYYFDGEIKQDSDTINSELQDVSTSFESIIDSLYRYISEKLHKQLESHEKEKIYENFAHFLMNNGYSDKYSDLISLFVVSNSSNPDFERRLNSIKEGIIIYQGISFTADLNQLGSWETDLDIYLAPEHLFHALGYNGVLFEEIFNDFYKLVLDINRANPPRSSKRQKKIQLFYLTETKEEIDDFFTVAESIIKGQRNLDPSKIAMEKIIKGSNSVSDIKQQQVAFYTQLKRKEILETNIEFDVTRYPEYNIVDTNIIEELASQSKKRDRIFDEAFCHRQLNLFSKINYKRQGKNSLPIEKISHIYMTENALSKFLAHNNSVKFDIHDTAFAKDIDFLISRFWFKLKKGFNSVNEIPKSFNLVNKAKIIISSYVNSNVALDYQKITEQYHKQQLSMEEVVSLNLALKEKLNLPEHFTSENVDKALDFLNDGDFIENIRRENERKATLLQETQIELAKYKEKEETERKLELAKQQQHRNTLNALSKWNVHRSNGHRAMAYSFIILILNINLALTAFLFGFNSGWKNWLTKWGSPQIIVATIYLLCIVIEVFGSKYIFDKEKIKLGFKWLLVIFSYKNYKNKFINQAIVDLNQAESTIQI